jgi:hypothetical protein
MSVEQFAKVVESAKGFVTDSGPDRGANPPRKKVLAIIGGEPLLHPHFEQLAIIMRDAVADKRQRGLWTGVHWRQSRHADLIADTFGYINENHHEAPHQSLHSPVLVASKDVVADESTRNDLIDKCWLQKTWSSAITPKGMFFCEVAGAMDNVFDGPGGLPIEPRCWERPLSDFREQIDRWCPRCGIPLQLHGRLDAEARDDVSQSNLDALIAIGSPRIMDGEYVLYDPEQPQDRRDCPWRYMQ